MAGKSQLISYSLFLFFPGQLCFFLDMVGSHGSFVDAGILGSGVWSGRKKNSLLHFVFVRGVIWRICSEVMSKHRACVFRDLW